MINRELLVEMIKKHNTKQIIETAESLKHVKQKLSICLEGEEVLELFGLTQPPNDWLKMLFPHLRVYLNHENTLVLIQNFASDIDFLERYVLPIVRANRIAISPQQKQRLVKQSGDNVRLKIFLKLIPDELPALNKTKVDANPYWDIKLNGV